MKINRLNKVNNINNNMLFCI